MQSLPIHKDKDRRVSMRCSISLHLTNLALNAWISFSIKPPQSSPVEARRKDFTHQTVVSRVQGHQLAKVVHMFNWVPFSIVDDESRSVEKAWYLYSLDVHEKRGS